MAIKGKKKRKAGGRPKAAAPKREVVVPKIPLWSRKGFQLSLAAIIALIVGLGLGYGFGNQAVIQAADAASLAKRNASVALQTSVDSALSLAGQASETGFVAFPELDQALLDADSDASPSTVIKAAKRVAAKAGEATKQLQAIPVDNLGEGLPEADVDELSSIRDGLAHGTALYDQAGESLLRAAKSSRADRTALMGASQRLSDTARVVFNAAYGRYQALLLGTAVVLPAPAVDPNAPGGVIIPEGVVPEGAVPPGSALPPGSDPAGGLPPPGS